MLTARRPAAVAAAVVAAGALGTLPAAAADPDVDAENCSNIYFCVGVSVPGHKGATHQKPAKDPKGKTPPAGSIPCIVTKMDPQPPADSAAWDGHNPGDGAVYTRVCPVLMNITSINGGSGLPTTFWSAAQPTAAVDPAQLAQEALDKMTLKGPDINISPKPGGKGVVGMPVWMAATKSQTTWGPNTASASAGGVTVTATAKVTRVIWSMGDGTSVTCTSPGTPYKQSYGLKKSPDCGHVYTQPSSSQGNGEYHVTALSTWTVDWEGGGQTGQLTATRNSAVDITIAEVQVLN